MIQLTHVVYTTQSLRETACIERPLSYRSNRGLMSGLLQADTSVAFMREHGLEGYEVCRSAIKTQMCKCMLRRYVCGTGEGRRRKVTAISSVSETLGGEYHQSKENR